MATTINYTTVRSPQRTTGVPGVCPACGGLECLCRPRFFAGQLLTEQDLNLLDHYIVAKQKLHNRYLHGWGVVCGLDVVCDVCGEGSVIVRSGYALAPCGEDVIVCNDSRVPVCDLISNCRDIPDPDCLAPAATGGCDDPIQQWILAICYSETPSRGVAPLKSSCGCSCGCGNSGGCGCGGSRMSSGGSGCGCNGGKKNGNGSSSNGCGCGSSPKGGGTVATTSASRGASLMQCENTVVCEGYCFRVYRKPRTTEKPPSIGAMAQAFLDCITTFADAMPTFTPTFTDQQELHDWCCEMHDAWADWFLNHPPYNCELPQRIAAIPCPDVGDPNFDSMIDTAKSAFLIGALEILISCFCSIIMPPCPPSLTDDCVPLAVITVRTDNGCKVQSICNWTVYRKYVTTFPSLQYWLSFLPFGRLLREALEGLCCRPFFRRRVVDQPANNDVEQPIAARRREFNAAEQPREARAANARAANASNFSPSEAFRPSTQTLARSRAFMAMAMNTLTSKSPPANTEHLVAGILGEKDAQGKPYLSEMESENLLQYLVLDQMAKPTMRNLFAQQGAESEGGVGGMLRTLSAMMGGGAGAATAEEGGGEGRGATSAELGAQIDELRATVDRQSQQIEELLRARRGRNK